MYFRWKLKTDFYFRMLNGNSFIIISLFLNIQYRRSTVPMVYTSTYIFFVQIDKTSFRRFVNNLSYVTLVFTNISSPPYMIVFLYSYLFHEQNL